jgi:hypothetical protein
LVGTKVCRVGMSARDNRRGNRPVGELG